MWIYEKKLQFPVDVRGKDLRLAKALIVQYGGPYRKQRLHSIAPKQSPATTLSSAAAGPFPF